MMMMNSLHARLTNQDIQMYHHIVQQNLFDDAEVVINLFLLDSHDFTLQYIIFNEIEELMDDFI